MRCGVVFLLVLLTISLAMNIFQGLAVVNCRPDITLGGISMPTNDAHGSGLDISVDNDGITMETKEVQESENTEATKEHESVIGRTDEKDGTASKSVEQSSEVNKTHLAHETHKETKEHGFSLGKNGASIFNKKTSEDDRVEVNKESGKETYKETERDQNSNHTLESKSQYDTSEKIHDHHTSHDNKEVSLLGGGSLFQEDKGSSDKHEEKIEERGSYSDKEKDSYKDGHVSIKSLSEDKGSYHNTQSKVTENTEHSKITKAETKNKANTDFAASFIKKIDEKRLNQLSNKYEYDNTIPSLKEEFLQAVSDKIHHSRIINVNGKPEIVYPDARKKILSLAEKIGYSPVSAHYANAEVIARSYENIPYIRTKYGRKKIGAKDALRDVFEKKIDLFDGNKATHPANGITNAKNETETNNSTVKETNEKLTATTENTKDTKTPKIMYKETKIADGYSSFTAIKNYKINDVTSNIDINGNKLNLNANDNSTALENTSLNIISTNETNINNTEINNNTISLVNNDLSLQNDTGIINNSTSDLKTVNLESNNLETLNSTSNMSENNNSTPIVDIEVKISEVNETLIKNITNESIERFNITENANLTSEVSINNTNSDISTVNITQSLDSPKNESTNNSLSLTENNNNSGDNSSNVDLNNGNSKNNLSTISDIKTASDILDLAKLNQSENVDLNISNSTIEDGSRNLTASDNSTTSIDNSTVLGDNSTNIEERNMTLGVNIVNENNTSTNENLTSSTENFSVINASSLNDYSTENSSEKIIIVTPENATIDNSTLTGNSTNLIDNTTSIIENTTTENIIIITPANTKIDNTTTLTENSTNLTDNLTDITENTNDTKENTPSSDTVKANEENSTSTIQYNITENILNMAKNSTASNSNIIENITNLTENPSFDTTNATSDNSKEKLTTNDTTIGNTTTDNNPTVENTKISNNSSFLENTSTENKPTVDKSTVEENTTTQNNSTIENTTPQNDSTVVENTTIENNSTVENATENQPLEAITTSTTIINDSGNIMTNSGSSEFRSGDTEGTNGNSPANDANGNTESGQ